MPAPSAEIAAADRLRDSGKLIQAVEAYSALAQANPSDPIPMERIGQTLLRNGQYADAIEALSEARQRAGKPGSADAWMARAVLGEGRVDDALRLARTLRDQAPAEPLALEVLAEIHGRRGETADQIAALQSLADLRPGPASDLALGRALFPAQQFASLWTVADRLKKTAPDRGEGYLWSAFARFYIGGDDEVSAAIADARSACEKLPDNFRAPLILGRLLRRQRSWGPAIEALKSAAQRAPDRPEPYHVLAAAYAATGRTAEAAAARRRFAAGQAALERAEALLRRARREPTNLDLQIAAVAALRGQGNLRGAAEALNNANRTAPQDPRVRRLVLSWRGDSE